eukprot:2573692-Pleurochrysis_carterae.AAC.1
MECLASDKPSITIPFSHSRINAVAFGSACQLATAIAAFLPCGSPLACAHCTPLSRASLRPAGLLRAEARYVGTFEVKCTY